MNGAALIGITPSTPSPGAHIVWDWNGTLKDDLDDLLGAMNSTLDLLGEHPIDRNAYQTLHCVPIPDFYARVLGRPLTDDEWATAEGEFMRFLGQRPVRLRDGAKALLAHLRDSGYSQSLLSLLPHTRLLAETAESGVTHLFDRIDGRRAPGTTKAQALVTHLEAMGRPLDGQHEVLLIGDTRDDALAARTVGAHVVLVSGGMENAASLHQGGAAVADSLDQAVALGLRLVPPGTRGTALTTKSGTRQPIPGPGPGPGCEIDRRGASRRSH
ncbi:HAD family hydrolase [Streptomyces lydicus]|uniref:HAD family hydrolase n=1 Tax=Streptomyces lydicus TaxID=47763 RepID=UPI001012598E|nr:HAD hydrolase-like protein [Streptomyces lydicus]MCZ1006842.1 HAD hydrolase-like protein [Streptomyces lydicus]